MKKIWILLLILALLPTQLLALEVPDPERLGSVSVTMTFEGQPVPGGSLTAYRVGQIHVENGADYSFVLTPEYAESAISLEQPEAAAAPLAAYSKAKQLQGIRQTIDSQGCATFADLELGLYLLVQDTPASGYYPLEPFLVSVPAYQEDGSYRYDVDATPKLALEKDPTPPPPPPPPDLPQTGLNQWPIPVLAVSGSILLVLGLWLLLSKKRNA